MKDFALSVGALCLKVKTWVSIVHKIGILRLSCSRLQSATNARMQEPDQSCSEQLSYASRWHEASTPLRHGKLLKAVGSGNNDKV